MINHLKWLGGSACLSTLLLAHPLYANENDDLRQRLNELESIVIDMEAKMGGKAIANSFDSINMDFGGYYHGVAREFDTDNGEVAGFTRNLLYLRIEADVSEQWGVSFGNLFGQVDLEQPELASLEADLDGNFIPDYFDPTAAVLPAGTPLTPAQSNSNQIINQNAVTKLETFSLNFPVEVNLQYKPSDAFTATFGRQRAPVGHTTLYPMSWRTTELPRFMLGTNGVSHIFNPFVQGLGLGGQFFPGEGSHILSYSAFTGDTTATGAALKGEVTNEQSSARIGYAMPDQSFSVGLNYITGKREDRTFYGGNRFDAIGADVFVNIAGLRVLTEYYKSDEGNGGEPDREGYIFSPSFSITPNLEIVAVHDVMDAPIYQVANPAGQAVAAIAAGVATATEAGALAAGAPANIAAAAGAAAAAAVPTTVNAPSNTGKFIENSFGFNYKPVENVRLRLLHSIRTYEDLGDYEVKITSFSATASF